MTETILFLACWSFLISLSTALLNSSESVLSTLNERPISLEVTFFNEFSTSPEIIFPACLPTFCAVCPTLLFKALPRLILIPLKAVLICDTILLIAAWSINTFWRFICTEFNCFVKLVIVLLSSFAWISTLPSCLFNASISWLSCCFDFVPSNPATNPIEKLFIPIYSFSFPSHIFIYKNNAHRKER